MIVKLRGQLHAGPIRIAAELGLSASTIGAVIRREGLPHLADLDRITGEVIQTSTRRSNMRYEHPTPVTCCTSTSKSSAVSRTVAAGESTAKTPSCTARHGRVRTTCMSPSMTTTASPTSRSPAMKRATPALVFCTGQPAGSATAV